MTEQLLTQTQDHNRRLGRLEGIVDTEQFTEQGRQTNTRLDRMEQAIAAQGRCIEAQGSELREAIDEQGDRIDELMRWVVGIQVISLLALGTLILSRL